MPEINPYESPQSELRANAAEPQPDATWPAWLGSALWVQMAAIVITFIAVPIPFAPAHQAAWNTIVLCAIGMIGILTLLILISAIRNRIGWLLVLELIVLGLPIYAFVIILYG